MDNEAKEAAFLSLRQAAEDLTDALDGCDRDDPVACVEHLAEDVRRALSVIKVLEGSEDADLLTEDEDGEEAEETPDADVPPECSMCEGHGFGADADGAVACPQCGGTGTALED